LNPASTSFVLGYHGCDERVAARIAAGHSILLPSQNDYDWLGDGVYFWEHNAQRAYDYAVELASHPRNGRQQIKKPTVIGAVIDLGFCFNLLDSRYLQMLRQAYEQLVKLLSEKSLRLPENTGGANLLNRKLDCAVVRTLHQMRANTGEPPFDTVRAAFVEGDELYKNAGFASKNHIQICVREIRCIKGYFHPRDDDGQPLKFQ
jgi:hypothetical protein